MIQFSLPYWLLALAPLAILGALVLRRQWYDPVVVPTLKFWIEHQSSPTSPQKRRSWHWLPIVLAVMLISVALAGPYWQPEDRFARIGIPEVVMRGISGSSEADLFLRLEQFPELHNDVTLKIDDGVISSATPQSRNIPNTALKKGTTIRIPAADSLRVSLEQHGQYLAGARLTRRTQPAFTIQTFGSSPLLERVLAIQPGAVAHGQMAGHHLKIITESSLLAKTNNINAMPGDCVIATGHISLPGIQYSDDSGKRQLLDHVPNWSTSSPMMQNVDLSNVNLLTIVPAALDSSWRVLAYTDQRPFVAVRISDDNVRILWLATDLSSAETDWPLRPSFVVFFTNVVNDWLSAFAQSDTAWDIMIDPQPKPLVAKDLSAYVGLAAFLSLMLGMFLIARS